MTTHTCHNCKRPVNRADAALRSICFEQVAYHPVCLQVELAVDAVFELASARGAA